MNSTNNLNKNNNYVYDESQSITTTYDSNNDSPYCRICGVKFDDMAKMQIHVMIEHMDKGEFPED